MTKSTEVLGDQGWKGHVPFLFSVNCRGHAWSVGKLCAPNVPKEKKESILENSWKFLLREL